jgi:hypothetical protein
MFTLQNQRRWTNNRQSVANQKLMKWIINSVQPINTVNNEYLSEFLNCLNSNYKIPNEKNLKLLIHQSFNWSESEMKKLLEKSSETISLTTDLWTSRAKQGFIGITASFINENFELINILLDLKYLPYPHTAEVICEQLKDTINTWNLQNKIIAVTTDNGSNMIKAISLMNRINTVVRIPCTAHTLQLVIGKGLDPIFLLIARVKRLIRFFISPKQLERLKLVQRELEYEDIVGIISDINTRWNSTYHAWERLLYLRDAIEALAIKLARDNNSNIKKDGQQLKKINLVEDEWIFIESLINLLASFEEATTILGGETYATLNLMHPIISELQGEFIMMTTNLDTLQIVDLTNETTVLDDDDESILENDDESIDPKTKRKIQINRSMSTEGVLDQIKVNINHALNKYWNVPSDLGLMATILDPRMKILNFATITEKSKAKELIINELRKFNIQTSESEIQQNEEIIQESGNFNNLKHNINIIIL